MLIVQKYGGTSVANIDRIRNVAARAVETARKGHKVTVVVSAMAGETDRLIGLAREIAYLPDDREMDMVMSSGERVSSALTALAIKELGGKSMSFTGRQIGMRTDAYHTRARITSIDAGRLLEALREGCIPVVAGFQGISPEDNVTTLGRGGSDTSAVAIAAAIGADRCDIYTDVDGVYTTDPNVVPTARKLQKISYDEMLEMASLGAKVLQTRSVEFAKNHNVPILVRSSFNKNPGTLVTKEDKDMERVVVSGIAYDKNQAKITVANVPDQPGIAAELFRGLARAQINVDMIVQNISSDGKHADISFTIPETDSGKALKTTQKVAKKLGARAVDIRDDIAKVSIVGVGMRSHSGVASTMFDAFASHGINILMISTSEIKVSCVVDEMYTELAVRVLHDAFELEKADHGPARKNKSKTSK